MHSRLVHITLFIFLAILQLQAESKQLHVLSKTRKETFTFKKPFLLQIDAEKANIIIKGTNSKEVKVTLIQTVKDKNETVVEHQIEAHQATFKKERDRLLIRNFFVFGAGEEKPTSIFNTSYIVEVPKHLCHVKVENLLGDIHLVNLDKSVRLDINYGKVSIDNSSIQLLGKVNIGDLIIKKSFLDATIDASNTLIRVNQCSGSFSGKLEFGSFHCVLNKQFSQLELEAENTDITLVNPEKLIYSMVIKHYDGEINSLDYMDRVRGEDGFQLLELIEEKGIGDIRIENKYGNINIY